MICGNPWQNGQKKWIKTKRQQCNCIEDTLDQTKWHAVNRIWCVHIKCFRNGLSHLLFKLFQSKRQRFVSGSIMLVDEIRCSWIEEWCTPASCINQTFTLHYCLCGLLGTMGLSLFFWLLLKKFIWRSIRWMP